MTVHLLVIEHRHGRNLAVHETREGAEANLDAYVQEWWTELNDVDQPGRREDRIRIYFQDHPDNETYQIEACEVME